MKGQRSAPHIPEAELEKEFQQFMNIEENEVSQEESDSGDDYSAQKDNALKSKNIQRPKTAVPKDKKQDLSKNTSKVAQSGLHMKQSSLSRPGTGKPSSFPEL